MSKKEIVVFLLNYLRDYYPTQEEFKLFSDSYLKNKKDELHRKLRFTLEEEKQDMITLELKNLQNLLKGSKHIQTIDWIENQKAYQSWHDFHKEEITDDMVGYLSDFFKELFKQLFYFTDANIQELFGELDLGGNIPSDINLKLETSKVRLQISETKANMLYFNYLKEELAKASTTNIENDIKEEDKIQWLGNQKELAELFIELEKNGWVEKSELNKTSNFFTKANTIDQYFKVTTHPTTKIATHDKVYTTKYKVRFDGIKPKNK